MKKIVAAARRGVLAVVSDQTLYLFLAFMYWTVLQSNLFRWYRPQIDLLYSYVVIPWSMTLCALRLVRADEHALMKKDTALLALMFLWVTVPFYLRFGFTFNNVTSWYGHAVVFFTVYSMTRETDAARRAAQLDRLCALFGLASFIWGGMLLLALLTREVYTMGNPDMEYAFGFVNSNIQMGLERNMTAMSLTPMLMMSLVGLCRRKSWLGRILYLVSTVIMVLCITLTQSLTSRYAMIAAFAVGAYGAVYSRVRISKAVLRHGAALAAAVVMLLIGMEGVKVITQEAVDYYNGQSDLIAQASAEETAETEAAAKPAAQVRTYVWTSMEDRVAIWGNVIKLLKENPKHMFIGRGIGNVGRFIVEGTLHEADGSVAVHNTYLQLLADFGIIGAVITLAFFLVVFFPALRVFLAPAQAAFPGGRALCMMVAAILVIGMMESQPLGANTHLNMMLYYALAVLCAEGERMGRKA